MASLSRPLFARGLAVLLLGGAAPAAAEAPAWTDQRPVVADHAVGIASADIDAAADLDEAHNRAFAAALRDIAGQVSVEVRSETGVAVREDAAGIAVDFSGTVAASSRASLPGVELVDTWTDGERAWVYARFDLARHRQGLLARRQALQAALEAIARPGSRAAAGLAAGVRALAATPEGEAEAQREALLAALGQHLAALEFTDVAAGVAAGTPWLQVRLRDRRTGEPAAGVPVRFVSKMDAPLTARTDAGGMARVQLSGISDAQLVSARVDPGAWLDAADRAGARLQGLPQPATQIELRGARRAAHLVVTVDAETPLPGLAQDVAGILAAHGLDLHDTATDTSLRIEVRVRARSGNTIAGIHFAFVDVGLTVDAADGQRLYATMAPRIKGAGSSFAEAVRAALHNPCVRFSEAAAAGREVRIQPPLRRRSQAAPTPHTGTDQSRAAVTHPYQRT